MPTPISRADMDKKLKGLVVTLAAFALKTFFVSLGVMCLLLALLCGMALLSSSHAIATNKVATLVASIDAGAFERVFVTVYVGVILFFIGFSSFWKSSFWRLN